ncbi:hypothetical protein [Gorillibacterium sp. sgz5001074]|uniref:hypothetical protein n=1 Tax=Gorillibacterium sp. sgz5001074 TaxID=3446695 RepID=UPI003F66A9FA
MKKKPEIPPLYGITGAAKALNVTRQNMPNTMKAKDFPAPDTMIDGKPYWLQSTIHDYAIIHEKRKKTRREDDQI